MNGLFTKLRFFLASAHYKRSIVFIVVLIIAAIIPLTVITSQKTQEIRQRATYEPRTAGAACTSGNDCGPNLTCDLRNPTCNYGQCVNICKINSGETSGTTTCCGTVENPSSGDFQCGNGKACTGYDGFCLSGRKCDTAPNVGVGGSCGAHVLCQNNLTCTNGVCKWNNGAPGTSCCGTNSQCGGGQRCTGSDNNCSSGQSCAAAPAPTSAPVPPTNTPVPPVSGRVCMRCTNGTMQTVGGDCIGAPNCEANDSGVCRATPDAAGNSCGPSPTPIPVPTATPTLGPTSTPILTPTPTQTQYLAADVNHDRCVSGVDSSLWLNAVRGLAQPPYILNGQPYFPDINNDGHVSGVDYSIWLSAVRRYPTCPYQL